MNKSIKNEELVTDSNQPHSNELNKVNNQKTNKVMLETTTTTEKLVDDSNQPHEIIQKSKEQIDILFGKVNIDISDGIEGKCSGYLFQILNEKEEEFEQLKEEIIELYDDNDIEQYNDIITEPLKKIKYNVCYDGFDMDFNLEDDEMILLLQKMIDSNFFYKDDIEFFKVLLVKIKEFVTYEKSLCKIKEILISRNNKKEIILFV